MSRKSLSSMRVCPDYVLSLQFLPQSLRVGVFRRKGRQWTLVGLSNLPLSEKQDKPQIIQSLLEVKKLLKVPKNCGVIAAWSRDFIERPVVLPEIPPSEVSAALTFGMEQNFQVKLSECHYSWITSGEVVAQQGTKARQYFIYAIAKSAAQDYLDIMNAVGEYVLGYSPTTVAHIAVLQYMGQDSQSDMALLDIGVERTTFLIFRQGKPYLSREVEIGVKQLLESVGDPTLLTQVTLDESVRGPLDPDQNQTVLAAMQPILDGFKDTIETTVAYYAQQNETNLLKSIFLCGDWANILGLDKYLSKKVELPVQRASYRGFRDFVYAKPVEKEVRADFGSYLGVLGGFMNWSGNGLNLVPERTLLTNTVKHLSNKMRLATGLLVCAAVFVIVTALMSLFGTQKELNSLIERVNNSQAVLQVANTVSEEKQFKAVVSKGELAIMPFMKFISESLPEHCLITGLNYDRSKAHVFIEGKLYEKVEDPVAHCSNFVKRMNESPFIASADLTEGRMSKTGDEYFFKIKASLYED